MEKALKTISFRDSAWLHHHPLNPDNVLEYFMLSPFYDWSCNNQVLSMQNRPKDELLNMVGIEFALSRSHNTLFVIHKRYRKSPTHTDILASHYIWDGTIYQAPDLRSIVSSRLVNSTHFLAAALGTLVDGIEFSAITGYGWKTTKAKMTRDQTHALVGLDRCLSLLSSWE